MATVTIAKNISSDIRTLNFSAFEGGVSYSESATLFVISYGSGWKHEFRGTGFTYNANHEFTGGTVTGFSENFGLTRAFSIDQISVAASTIAAASRTVSTADDFAVIAAVLAGNDRFLGGDKADYLNGFDGADLLYGNAGNDTLLGGAGNDTLSGGVGNDVLAGGVGADRMLGGAGNDIYQVDNAGDIVDESAAGSNGADTVQSSISFSLANVSRVKGAVEHLTLLGTAALSGTGNGLANVLRGNSAGNVLNGAAGNDTLLGGAGNDTLLGGTGNDVLAGGAGADRMLGGAGNDVYQVDNAGDIVDESAAGSNGADTVQSTISFSLANVSRVKGAVEHLTLLGTTALNGTGNGLANVLRGNSAGNTLNGAAGNDTLLGGAGKDVLIGGAGHDTFVFNTPLNPVTNVDVVKDFNVLDDRIALDNAVMPGLGSTLGTLSAAQFWKSSSGLAHDASDRIIYETDTGKLFYDANGNGPGGGVHFATLAPNLQLTNTDFVVI